MRIVLLGPPGAGKGTQAKRLAETFDMRHLSSGDILRAEKASGSELGKKLAEYMNAGKLVPDDVVVDVMAKAIAAPSESSGLLLDGFPRTVPQAEALDVQLAKLDAPLDKVVDLEVSEDEVVRRISGRRTCPDCGAIYHVEFLKPSVEGKCDKCGYEGDFVQREDDKEEVVRQRLATYNAQTAPLLGYYQEKAPEKVLIVDGNQSPDAVTVELKDKLGA
jgi:adenylate kinase